MKTPIKILMLSAVALFMSSATFYPGGLFAERCGRSFWVLETNSRESDLSTLRFYDANCQLLYTGTFTGIIDIKSDNNKMLLNNALKRFLKGKELPKRLRNIAINPVVTKPEEMVRDF